MPSLGQVLKKVLFLPLYNQGKHVVGNATMGVLGLCGHTVSHLKNDPFSALIDITLIFAGVNWTYQLAKQKKYSYAAACGVSTIGCLWLMHNATNSSATAPGGASATPSTKK